MHLFLLFFFRFPMLAIVVMKFAIQAQWEVMQQEVPVSYKRKTGTREFVWPEAEWHEEIRQIRQRYARRQARRRRIKRFLRRVF